MNGNGRRHNLKQIFDFIVRHKVDHDGNSPNFDEIASSCGISSRSVVSYNLRALENLGLIRLVHSKRARSIEVVNGQWTFTGAGQ